MANYEQVGSKRHRQILTVLAQGASANGAYDVGDTPEGKLVVFNYKLFVVKPFGFTDACRKESDIPECSAVWQRVNHGRDPFDVQ